MVNTEALSMLRKGMDFDAEDLIRVVSTLGEIKKKKRREKSRVKKLKKLSGAKGI